MAIIGGAPIEQASNTETSTNDDSGLDAAQGVQAGTIGPDEPRLQRRRVRVWFGTEVICSHVAGPGEAERYARVLARRFAGLTITIDDTPGAADTGLPHELLWEHTVR